MNEIKEEKVVKEQSKEKVVSSQNVVQEEQVECKECSCKKKKNPKVMDVKDLINVGLFTVLLALVTMVGSFVGLVPQLMPIIPVVVGLLTGPIYMLYATKIRKPFMFFITLFLMGCLFAVTGHGFWTIITYSIGGGIGELILWKGKYKSINAARLAVSVASLSCIGQMLPMYISRDAYISQLVEQGYTLEYAQEIMKYMPAWSIAPILIGAFIMAFVGCTIGILMLKKHFVKAGMVKEF